MLFAYDREEKWEKIEWKQNGIEFTIPSWLEIQSEDEKEWTADDGESFSMTITVWQDMNRNEKEVAYQSYDTWEETSDKEIIEEDSIDLPNRRLKAYYISGQGYQEEKLLSFIIVGFIVFNSDLNFAIRFAWWDEEEHNEYFQNIAEKIVKSIQIFNPQTQKQRKKGFFK